MRAAVSSQLTAYRLQGRTRGPVNRGHDTIHQFYATKVEETRLVYKVEFMNYSILNRSNTKSSPLVLCTTQVVNRRNIRIAIIERSRIVSISEVRKDNRGNFHNDISNIYSTN